METYPLDVLDAETEGAIGLHDRAGTRQPALPFERPFATLLTMIEDTDDPAFANLTKFIGPVYDQADADRLAAEKGWTKADGAAARRRVAGAPRIFELRPMKWLLEKQLSSIAAGGGGIPTGYDPTAERKLVGVECVDKDPATELLARELSADLYP